MNAETLRTICLQQPFVVEEIKWGADLVFSVGKKMFCITSFEEPFKASFKVTEEEFGELCSRPGFTPAPYLARAHWVMVANSANLTTTEWEQYIKQSYAMVAKKLTKKEKLALGIQL